MLFSARKVSSACTGALTSDMALSVIQKTINESNRCRKIAEFNLVSVHETCFEKGYALLVFMSQQIKKTYLFWMVFAASCTY